MSVLLRGTDQGNHPPHLQLHQQRSSAEGRRPPPVRPGSDGGPARQPQEQRAEEQIPAHARTPEQGPHVALTHAEFQLEKQASTPLFLQTECHFSSCCKSDLFGIF